MNFSGDDESEKLFDDRFPRSLMHASDRSADDERREISFVPRDFVFLL